MDLLFRPMECPSVSLYCSQVWYESLHIVWACVSSYADRVLFNEGIVTCAQLNRLLGTSPQKQVPSMQAFGREGFTADTVLAISDYTLKSPLFTGAWLLRLLYRNGLFEGLHFSNISLWIQIIRERVYKRGYHGRSTLSPVKFQADYGTIALVLLFVSSCLNRYSTRLSRRTRNNFQRDTYIWHKEIVLVTGASSGIGKRVCEMLAAKDIKVVGVDVNEPTFSLPPTMSFYTCDITDRAQVHAVATKIRSERGHPTILLNNAGIAKMSPILTQTEKDATQVLQVNAISHFFTVQEFLPNMIEHNHGHVLTISSMAGYCPVPGLCDYAMSKAACMAFHECLSMELIHLYKAPTVRTTLVNPLWTRTAMLDVEIDKQGHGHAIQSKAKADLVRQTAKGPRTMHVDTVAEQIVDAILSGESGHLIMPRAVGVASALRGLPAWFHYGVLSRASKDMEKFKSP